LIDIQKRFNRSIICEVVELIRDSRRKFELFIDGAHEDTVIYITVPSTRNVTRKMVAFAMHLFFKSPLKARDKLLCENATHDSLFRALQSTWFSETRRRYKRSQRRRGLTGCVTVGERLLLE